MKRMFQLLIWATVVVGSQSADAAIITFEATGLVEPGLSGANEGPSPNASPATGSAIVTWDTTLNLMTVSVEFDDLIGLTTAAHIHCCITPPVLATSTIGVATTLPTFPGFPLGTTGGTYDEVFDMLDLASYNPSFVAAHGGTAASAGADLLAGMLAGQAYLNIHTTAFPGGEIRGFLQEVAAVPEPATLWSLGLGVTALAARVYHRRRQRSHGR